MTEYLDILCVMLKLVMVYLLVALLAFAKDARAEDAAQHVAASAAITAALYLTLSALSGREERAKRPALISAVAMALAIGFAKESVDSMARGDRRIDGHDMLANGIGVGGASCALILLDW